MHSPLLYDALPHTLWSIHNIHIIHNKDLSPFLAQIAKGLPQASAESHPTMSQ